jgi:hypothetical protein
MLKSKLWFTPSRCYPSGSYTICAPSWLLTQHWSRYGKKYRLAMVIPGRSSMSWSLDVAAYSYRPHHQAFQMCCSLSTMPDMRVSRRCSIDYDRRSSSLAHAASCMTSCMPTPHANATSLSNYTQPACSNLSRCHPWCGLMSRWISSKRYPR